MVPYWDFHNYLLHPFQHELLETPARSSNQHLFSRVKSSQGLVGILMASPAFFFCLELEPRFVGEAPPAPIWNGSACCSGPHFPLWPSWLLSNGIVLLLADSFIAGCPTRLPAPEGRGFLCLVSPVYPAPGTLWASVPICWMKDQAQKQNRGWKERG